MTNNFSVQMLDIEKCHCPMLTARFKGKDGLWHNGVMVVDTGSIHCILNSSVLSYVNPDFKNGRKMQIHTMDNGRTEFSCVNLSFMIDDQSFEEEFWSNEDVKIQLVPNIHVIGIVGVRFLVKHSLVVDFEAKSVHAAVEKFSEDINSFDFFFPMDGGINVFGIPVVCMTADGKNDYALAVDTGANQTIITKHAIDEGKFTIRYLKENSSVHSLNSVLQMDCGVITMKLVCIDGELENPKTCDFEEDVLVADSNDLMVDPSENNGLAFPLSGLLAASFMLKHKWILDFSRKIIYGNEN